MRYVIKEMIADKDHVLAGQTIFYLWDSFKNELSLAYYITREKAEFWCRKKNNVKE